MATTADTVLSLLADRQSYSDRTERVERIDTHISWVFLTDRFVYKLKKPVRYDFVDFSTLEKRHAACLREVELNRRLARHVYLDVIPITKTRQGVLKLGRTTGAETIDWVVKMRRLPSTASLEQLIRSDHLRKSQVEELARFLADFYLRLPPLRIAVETYRDRLTNHIEANYQELNDWATEEGKEVVKRVHAAQLRLLRLASDVLDARVCDGRIAEGHGDLRPDHIYFDPRPTIIDCIEFNDELRRLDVVDELAFLAVECEQLGMPWIGERMIEHHRSVSHDDFPMALLDFYKTYRACVRAKVTVLRGKQVDEASRLELDEKARSYLRLADRHARSLGPPVLLVVYGLSGTGKSTLANRLSELLAIDVLSTDTIRRATFGPAMKPATFGQDLYQPALRLQIYDALLEQAERMLATGTSVILDGTFSSARLRSQAVEIARSHGAVPVLVHCECPVEIAAERIDSRRRDNNSASDATLEIYQRQCQEFEPDPLELTVCTVDTSQGTAAVIETIFDVLRTGLPALHSPWLQHS